MTTRFMRIAIEGCCHGQLDNIYDTIKRDELATGKKVDLVLICGDFQAVRNMSDLACMSVPDKYKKIGNFWKYYSGKVKAPYPTIFIGGNHEASNYLWELYYGGWVCDGIYYLGNAGVINFGGLRIAGLSGIYSEHSYYRSHYEVSPYKSSEKKSVYHVRDYDVKKLLQIREPVDIFLSHDWPRGIERHGDVQDLIKRKPFFEKEILSRRLGSFPNELLLSKIQPARWFAAHLHVRYEAEIDHNNKDNYTDSTKQLLEKHNIPVAKNLDEIKIEEDDDDGSNGSATEKGSKPPKTTKFLSLDKCLPHRQYLEIIDVPVPCDENNEPDFYYDLEWLSITKAMNKYLSVSHQHIPMPSDEKLKEEIAKEREQLEKQKQHNALDLKIPHNFEPTAPAHGTDTGGRNMFMQLQRPFFNPQTDLFCKVIGIENKINANGQRVDEVNNAGTSINDSSQDTKRQKVAEETIQSEITIDESEFL
ncbi:hypothetical protein G6F70_002658 [Rhizopus microsporus]|uniref:Lariat debranching enzyme C-terminal domain-containing protein n=1 Tax=Rhizopus azygosporus TaxID=86630 RepID=A0A367JYP6_RHIAZ|nr:hypothetical protein G6F71_007090 [Rhizopus microsporus]RCH95019.1 hypothetical protein CU097_013539 [Rhizopus azygosporus]KAG1202006.1 hypothetical protein G6F70_002658 [Rhizopus microsporus]KAG1213125.1 hypothetical protein G6F69_003102 [Rhizopus microsporus]KAG1229966.1 hypothetical protein G6F67_006787 [Rhizopus microsporus]